MTFPLSARNYTGAGALTLGGFAADLTATERRILELRASGLNRNEIALLLSRSPQTISNSLTVAKEKLGARSLLEAAALISSVLAPPRDMVIELPPSLPGKWPGLEGLSR